MMRKGKTMNEKIRLSEQNEEGKEQGEGWMAKIKQVLFCCCPSE
jgi:hypothetical protein